MAERFGCDGNGRLVIIGLDGVTFDLVRPWAEAGELPVLARLMREGAQAPLRSVLHPYTAQAWTSMITGQQPGRHRVFDFWERDFGTYGFRLLNASHRATPSLWRRLSDAGRRVVVINVPQTYPPEPVAGLLISGRDTPGLDAAYTYPPELKRELPKAAGGRRYVIVADDWLHMRRGRPDMARQALLEEVEIRFAVARHLMADHPWDLTMFVVGATDGAAHFFWKYHDPDHILYDPADALRYGDTILEVYRRCDAEIGRLLADLPPNTTVLIVSDHGNGPVGDRAVHLNLWLEREGLLRFAAAGERSLGRQARAAAVSGLQRLKKALYARLPFQEIARLRRLFPDQFRRRLGSELFFPGIDWGHTRAFSEELRGNIWINLRGRDPQGIVEPGAEYEALRETIIARLPSLRDPVSSERLIHRVWRREELYSGPYVERLPDLIVEGIYPDLFRPRGGYRGHPVHRLTPQEAAAMKTSGGHRLHGLLIAWGPAVQAGATLPEAEITDIAPTALYLLGQPVPQDMDGRVLTELLAPDVVAARPVRFATTGSAPTAAEELTYTQEEETLIGERLEGMGYLG